MRRILTKEEKDKKGRRNKTIIGLVLVALMIFSTAGYAFFSGSKEERTEIEYNGVDFVLGDSGMWQFQVQNFEFLTQYNPKDTENISVLGFATINSYNAKPLFFSGEGAGKLEIARNLQNFVLRMQDACLSDGSSENGEDCEADLPIKNCSQDNIIVLKETENVSVTEDDNCIFISSPYSEQVRTADAFLFKILGVRSF